jgi:hypothetical protein
MKGLFGRLPTLLLLLAFSATPAYAAWSRAETDRFIIYADGGEEVVREYARKLHAFDAMLRTLHLKDAARRPGHKLEVFLVGSGERLRRVNPHADPDLRGFYSTGPARLFAIATTGEGATADEVLFHEYAHHFLLENFSAAYPAWFVEGWAEYFMTAEIGRGQVKVGGYNESRVNALLNAEWEPLEEVLRRPVAEIPPDRRYLFYAQAWLLVHYMQGAPERAAQLERIVVALAAGAEPVQAFREIGGLDTPQLVAAMRAYRKPRRLVVQVSTAAPAAVVTSLSEAEGEFHLDRLRLACQPPNGLDGAWLEDLRRRAAAHSGERLAALALAEAEFALGDAQVGEAVIARRLAAQPDDAEVLRVGGLGQLAAGLRAPEERTARFRAARAYFERAMSLGGPDYRALLGYAQSRTVEPDFPDHRDLDLLLQARALAPSVATVSLAAGMALIRRGEWEQAALVLAPLANAPHGGEAAVQARALLAGRSLDQGEAKAGASRPAG